PTTIHSIRLQHIRQAKEEQQNRPFMPLINQCGSTSGQDHQQINVNFFLAQASHTRLHAKVASGHIAQHIDRQYQTFFCLTIFQCQAEENREQSDHNHSQLNELTLQTYAPTSRSSMRWNRRAIIHWKSID